MAVIPISQKKAARCLKVPLKPVEQVYLMFAIPVYFNYIVYGMNLSIDSGLVMVYFFNGYPIWGAATLALMYAPAIVYFTLTVSRPDWWMTEDEKLKDGALVWFAKQVLRLVVFPAFTIYRFAALLFLATGSLIVRGAARREYMREATKPEAIELLFFLIAWFQAAPQALFQTHLFFREYKHERTYQTVVVQVMCVMTSVLVVALKATSFQRFESQRISGRRLPWATWLEKPCNQEAGNREEKKPLQEVMTSSMMMKPLAPGEETSPEGETGDTEASKQPLERQVSTTPPLPPKNLQANPPPAPLRGLTTVASLPVPEMPAPPRPDSMVREPEVPSSERRVNIPESSSDDKTSKKLGDLPIPQRKYSVDGLDEDDAAGLFVSLLWWFCFILARVFAIAMFYEFFPMWLFGVIAGHYLLMISYLFYNAKYYDVTNVVVMLWLGFVYILCAIEYRVKFKAPGVSLLAYYTLVILQNTVMTVTWFVLADWSSFWYTYMFFAILISTASCIMCGGVYALLLKPKTVRVYAN